MAAIDLTGVSGPTAYTATVGTTWREFTLPDWAVRVTVLVEGEAGYVAFDSMGSGTETPQDGQAVGTHRIPVQADTPAEFRRRPPLNSKSLFVARASTSNNVTIILEGA